MASSPVRHDRNTRAARPPLTASPGFPWVVALWFAALLGIGSLILPIALVERASVATGLASVLPQATPPLGFTAQAMLALVGTVGGALLGFVLAKKIAAPKKTKAVAAGRVLKAREDVDDEGIIAETFAAPAPPAPGGRRRALAMAEEEGPSDFLNVVPVPGAGHEAEIEAVPAAAEAAPVKRLQRIFEADEAPDADDDQPFELEASAELTEEQEPEVQTRQEFVPSEPAVERQEFIAVAEAEAVAVVEDDANARSHGAETLSFSPPSLGRTKVSFRDFDPGETFVDEDDDEDGGEEDSTGFQPEFDGGEQFAMPESEEDVSDKQIFEGPDAAEFSREAPAMPQAFEPEADAADEDMDEQALTAGIDEEPGEGLVDLVQRLGATLEKHREWAAEQAVAAALATHRVEAAPAAVEEEPARAAETPLLGEFDAAGADDAAEAMAAWFGKPATAQEVEAESVTDAGDSEYAGHAGAEVEEVAQAPRYDSFAGTIAEASADSVTEDEDEDDLAELAASFSLPLNTRQDDAKIERPAFDQPPAAASVDANGTTDEIDDEDDEDVAVDEPVSANPFKQDREEFVRIEEPEPEAESAEPAVLFPGQEARRQPAARAFDPPSVDGNAAAARPRPSNDDNERALREALMNLQRMGK